MSRLAEEEQIEAYNIPQGVMAQMLRDMAAKGPGVITKIGLDTFVDPAREGGKMNRSAKKDIVERITLDGETWLRYRPIPVDVAVIRGTSADEDGYISLEEEVHYDEVASMAAAAKNNGGLVIAQVKYLKKRGELPCAQVKVRRTSASATRKTVLNSSVYSPREKAVLRLRTKGRLDRGEVPRAAREIKATPRAFTATPKINSR